MVYRLRLLNLPFLYVALEVMPLWSVPFCIHALCPNFTPRIERVTILERSCVYSTFNIRQSEQLGLSGVLFVVLKQVPPRLPVLVIRGSNGLGF